MSLVSEIMGALVERATGNVSLRHVEGADGPYRTLGSGQIELWVGGEDSTVDRMIRVTLRGGPVETQLLWLFCADDCASPHYHAQLVGMPGDRFVHNVDLLPRVDLALHGDYVAEVFEPLSEARAELVSEPQHACARGGVQPGMAVYLSPWGVVGAGAARDEVRRASKLFEVYLDHALSLSREMRFQGTPAALAARHAALVAAHTDSQLDARAWQGTERLVGVEGVSEIKRVMRDPGHALS